MAKSFANLEREDIQIQETQRTPNKQNSSYKATLRHIKLSIVQIVIIPVKWSFRNGDFLEQINAKGSSLSGVKEHQLTS